MPKVLRILNRFNLGGPVYNASYLSADLAPEYETLLIGGAQEPGELSALYIPEGEGLSPRVIQHMKRKVSLKDDRRAYREIRALIREFKPDIVHTHASKAGALGRSAAFREKVPVVVHTFHGHVFHSYFHPAKTQVFKKLERRLANKSDRIIAISEKQKYELSEVHKIADASKIEVIPLGFDLKRFTTDYDQRRSRFRADWNIPIEAKVVGIIGRLAPVKDHHLFIDTIASLKDRSSEKLVGVIIGDGELRQELETYSTGKGLELKGESPDLIFTSWITAIEEALPAMDVVMLTSHNEGTPVSLIEAQAAGIPVVSTDVGGVSDVLPNAESGFVVSIRSSEALANATLQILQDHSLSEKMAKHGQLWALEQFGRQRLAADMRSLYQKLL